MLSSEFTTLGTGLNFGEHYKEQLTKEVMSVVKEREEKAIKITWQFSIEKARTKLNRHYQQVQAENIRYKIT